MEMYDSLARFYDREYAQKADDLAFYLDVAARAEGPILEIGVGTGRVALPLVAAGHPVVGIDASAAMLQIARKKAIALPPVQQSRLSLVQQRMTELQLDLSFSLCLMPFRTFLHNLTQTEQLKTLEEIARHLLPNGLLVFDLFVPLYSLLSQQQWSDEWDQTDLSPGLSLQTSIQHDSENQLLKVTNRYRRKRQNKWRVAGEGSYTYRYIFRFEMEMLLRNAGFEMLSVYGGFDRRPYDYHSGLMVFEAKKLAVPNTYLALG
ncbi:class I SAM-dependent methyltransferase [candidate division KSB1 bacterium]|nr:class I SAM-dependent methyltransferase [candidate division KSB1 bacterium]